MSFQPFFSCPYAKALWSLAQESSLPLFPSKRSTAKWIKRTKITFCKTTEGWLMNCWLCRALLVCSWVPKDFYRVQCDFYLTLYLFPTFSQKNVQNTNTLCHDCCSTQKAPSTFYKASKITAWRHFAPKIRAHTNQEYGCKNYGICKKSFLRQNLL